MKSERNSSPEYLLTPRAVRERAREVLARAEAGGTHFVFRSGKLPEVADLVLETTRSNYPDLKIPFHSRWGHFRAGGIDRSKELDSRLSGLDPLEAARTRLDLVIPSVLLDAGAGDAWSYREESTGATLSRSEGLGVASFHLFLSGALSSDGRSLRADAEGLSRVTPELIAKHFQVSDANPLTGLEGRAALLRNLAEALSNREVFPTPRPGAIIDSLRARHPNAIPATSILQAVLEGLGSIWPGRIRLEGRNLGDVWRHSELGLIPFHKLSQWMTYSLIEPMESAGIRVSGVDELTGLAEYRNGGLMLDSGLIELRDPGHADREWTPDSDLIIEWRALTVALLDRIGEQVRGRLGRSPEELPLAQVLEGGTWWAGRRLATRKRKGGGPPLRLQSDGTVF